jgi:hypothetical protein
MDINNASPQFIKSLANKTPLNTLDIILIRDVVRSIPFVLLVFFIHGINTLKEQEQTTKHD